MCADRSFAAEDLEAWSTTRTSKNTVHSEHMTTQNSACSVGTHQISLQLGNKFALFLNDAGPVFR